MQGSFINELDEDRYLHGKVESLRAQRRAQLGPCACINTDCILEKMELKQNERRLNIKLNELRACLSMKEKELEMVLSRIQHEEAPPKRKRGKITK